MKKCVVCGKTYTKTITLKKLRGKYNPTSKKRKYPNLQWVKLPPEFAKKLGLPTGKRVRACTKCIKRLSKA